MIRQGVILTRCSTNQRFPKINFVQGVQLLKSVCFWLGCQKRLFAKVYYNHQVLTRLSPISIVLGVKGNVLLWRCIVPLCGIILVSLKATFFLYLCLFCLLQFLFSTLLRRCRGSQSQVMGGGLFISITCPPNKDYSITTSLHIVFA